MHLSSSSFGKYGHYRAFALNEIAGKKIKYAGEASCVVCHKSEANHKKKGDHARLSCEICHGAGSRHASYAGNFKSKNLPDSLLLNKPVERQFCARCHQDNLARVKIKCDTINFSAVKLVNTKDHNVADEDTRLPYKCIDCHNPHMP
ncbi:MAG: hypothetical protein NTW49_11705 [Bacteroidia bacterium]|nr:hypothetical protein [Bacteroidia bacterium]